MTGTGGYSKVRSGVVSHKQVLRFKPGAEVLFHTRGTNWCRKGIVIGHPDPCPVYNWWMVRLEDGSAVVGDEEQMEPCGDL